MKKKDRCIVVSCTAKGEVYGHFEDIIEMRYCKLHSSIFYWLDLRMNPSSSLPNPSTIRTRQLHGHI